MMAHVKETQEDKRISNWISRGWRLRRRPRISILFFDMVIKMTTVRNVLE